MKVELNSQPPSKVRIYPDTRGKIEVKGIKQKGPNAQEKDSRDLVGLWMAMEAWMYVGKRRERCSRGIVSRRGRGGRGGRKT